MTTKDRTIYDHSRICALLLALTVAVAAHAVKPKIFNHVDSRQMTAWVDSAMARMTIGEKIGQLMVIAVTTSDDKGSLEALKKQIERYKIGGLIFGKGDITTQAKVTNYAQSVTAMPLMIAADAEWGLAMRLSDAPEFPENMYLGAVGDDRLLYQYGREMARECRLLGVHVNLAPVLDVVESEENKALWLRSFGNSPERVARLGVAFSKGLEDNGVLSVAKHFPGHGSPTLDSHITLPTVEKSRTALNLCDLVPFKVYIDAGLSGVMSAHLHVPAVDGNREATSLSAASVTGLLRGELGFEGLAFTDALDMRGADTQGNNCVAALAAGNDILLMPRNIERDIAAIKAAIDRGELSEALIDERCTRVLSYKYALGLDRPQQIDEEAVAQLINSAEARVVLHRLRAATVTVLKDSASLLPFTRLEKTRIAVVTLGETAGKQDAFQQRCATYSAVDSYSYRAGEAIQPVTDRFGDYDVVVLAALTDRATYRAAMAKMAKKHGNVVSVIFSKPMRVKNYKDVINSSRAVVLAYDSCMVAQDYAAQVIYGGRGATGVLPVTIDGVAKAGTGVSYPPTRLAYGIPEEVGIDSRLLSEIDSIAGKCVTSGATPGCQVLVARRGVVVCDRSYGYTDLESKTPVTGNTLYDLASVSKPIGTLPGIMKLYDEGLIGIGDRASKYIPMLRNCDKEEITIEQLLYHESGMPDIIDTYRLMLDPKSYHGDLFKARRSTTYYIKVGPKRYGNKNARLRTDILSTARNDTFPVAVAANLYCNRAAYDTIMQHIYEIELRPTKKYLYSCLNFALLMNIEENVTHTRHDAYVNDNFFAPLGAWHTMYTPADKYPMELIAPTEQDVFLRKQLVHGYVHDEMAAFSGGVQGNAGLFSNAGDIAKICQMWLNGGTYGGDRYLSEKTVKLFTTAKSKNSRRGLGFDKPDKSNERNSPTCEEASAATFGHLGFTGTAFWVDPEDDLIFIFLCNRVNPTRYNSAFESANPRPTIFSAVYRALKD